MKKPWKTYHIDDMSPAGGDGWYFHFRYKSSNRLPPFDLPGPGLPPFQDEKRNHYVDDSNTGGPWDGSFENPYKTIQEGIDIAKKGDTIFVFPGIYQEKIIIDKDCIGLISLTYEQPIIDGGKEGNVVTIKGKAVNLHGFVIQNSGTFEEGSGLDIQSNDNTISGNIIKNNQNGVYIHSSSKNNVIFENSIQNNEWGIFIMHECRDNYLFNNNFIDNRGFHAKDYSINKWDSEFYYGNYWDDYKGSDNNGNGIGDTPYHILGESNRDNQPLMKPWQNKKPDTPIIEGITSGKIQTIYNFSVNSSDSSNHDLIYEIDWGDGSNEYISYSESGISINITHSWESSGDYLIKIRAIDYYGAESDWGTLKISMPKSIASDIIFQKLIYLFSFFEKIISLYFRYFV
ncbi:MAG: right-handed parallel beta-helix repeat-containing protein [Thermoplasmatales archaeon]|nr:right-handed parallel beta-helix repeat-containing protein [Thermoplasmatales archaeon]